MLVRLAIVSPGVVTVVNVRNVTYILDNLDLWR